MNPTYLQEKKIQSQTNVALNQKEQNQNIPKMPQEREMEENREKVQTSQLNDLQLKKEFKDKEAQQAQLDAVINQQDKQVLTSNQQAKKKKKKKKSSKKQANADMIGDEEKKYNEEELDTIEQVEKEMKKELEIKEKLLSEIRSLLQNDPEQKLENDSLIRNQESQDFKEDSSCQDNRIQVLSSQIEEKTAKNKSQPLDRTKEDRNQKQSIQLQNQLDTFKLQSKDNLIKLCENQREEIQQLQDQNQVKKEKIEQLQELTKQMKAEIYQLKTSNEFLQSQVFLKL